jgi:hypothetical protein
MVAERFHWVGLVGNLRLKLSGSSVKKNMEGVCSRLFQSSKCQKVVGGFLVIDFSHLPFGYFTIFNIAMV